jgi:hypothetical protein
MSDEFKPAFFMVIDVESIGLHGEGFAVGWVVIDREGNELDSRMLACLPTIAKGSKDSHEWVRASIPALRKTHDSAWQMRSAFFAAWLHWKAQGAVLAADVAFPVESRFLAQCIDDNLMQYEWCGPYPLIDIASVRFAAGMNPIDTRERLPSELPQHDPLADARQSARLLLEVIKKAEVSA